MSRAHIINRRQFLTALGLGAGSLYLPSIFRGKARAQSGAPTRVVFYITPHGSVPTRWNMRQAGRDNQEYDFSLLGLGESEFSQILQPLHRHRDKLLVVDGLCRATTLADEYDRVKTGSGGVNRHYLGQSHLLTSDWASNSGGEASGGARSLDQVIGDAVAQPGRWKSRVYGFQQEIPYNYVAANEPAPRESDPRAAFNDIMGLVPEPSDESQPTRDDLIRDARASVLDMAAQEYERLAPRLGAEDREKLERHRAHVRDLELALDLTVGPGCNPSFSDQGHVIDRFSRVAAMALACDLTRVMTIVAQNIPTGEFGAPGYLDMHQDIAHQSDPGQSGFDHMASYNRAYAEHFAYLLDQLNAVPEGDGTLLDHTAVVWLTELGAGNDGHDLHRVSNVVAGGANGYFRPGRYVHFPESTSVPGPFFRPDLPVGPGQTRLHLSLMHAMGMTNQDTFGLPEVNIGGVRISLRSPLPRLT